MSQAHDYHDALPGFNEAQLLYDGCEECERRGEDPVEALARMDAQRFARAWRRAAAYKRGELSVEQAVSHAEIAVLNVLWAVQVHLERTGWPIGQVPSRPLS